MKMLHKNHDATKQNIQKKQFEKVQNNENEQATKNLVDLNGETMYNNVTKRNKKM